ncbi:hypothetical protein EVAR_61670_1 [Eumeta japonica]|uniref:Uncharacterized protein n=1 Tax=Eumeta variegata TaxID=151549 RepID=A0A4C1YQW8_EUMVA|nr:hypothetical protein EVAR_61670_1 [Eumeta japonica]
MTQNRSLLLFGFSGTTHETAAVKLATKASQQRKIGTRGEEGRAEERCICAEHHSQNTAVANNEHCRTRVIRGPVKVSAGAETRTE